MMSVDGYLDQVRRRLAGMDGAVRGDILRELRSHLAESAKAGTAGLDEAIRGLGDPATVARRYKELYGYGAAYRLLFTAVAAAVAVFTIPALFTTEETVFPFGLSVLVLIGEVILLIWFSAQAGNRAGLVAGIAGCAGRLLAFGGAYAANRAESLVTPEGLALFLLVSVMLIVIGYVPGRAKQAWRKPGAEL